MIKTIRSIAKILQLTSCVILFGVVIHEAKAEPSLGIGTNQTNISPNYTTNIQQRLIGQYYSQKKYKEAIEEIDKLLYANPNDIKLLMKKAGIYADMEQYDKAIEVLDKVLQLDPNNSEAINLRRKLIALQPTVLRNEIGIDFDEVNVSGPKQWWQYASLHYYRFAKSGTYGARINYASRYGTTGEQYQLEAYPKFFDIGTLALSYAYANSTQILYPTKQYIIEPYIALPYNFEASLGERYLRSVGISVYNTTASLGKYIDDFFIWMRDYHFTPKASDYFELGVTRYFDTKNSFISVKGASGRAPDIADLAPLNQLIILRQYSINVTGQTNLTKCIIGRIGAGYINQKFPSGNVRNFADVYVGLYWQF